MLRQKYIVIPPYARPNGALKLALPSAPFFAELERARRVHVARQRIFVMRIRGAGRSIGAALCVAALLASAAAAETRIQFSLDSKIEGPAAPFLLPLEKGYYKAEGLNVAFDDAAGSLEPISRVAAGTHEMGFADINTLIKLRDTNPNMPVKVVFMVYNRPPFAVLGRKSRGISKPKDLEGKRLGAPAADGAFAQWPIFVQANEIDATKVTIDNVSMPVREPMLASGQIDAITGNSFTAFVNLKDKGVPQNDIAVLLMAEHGVQVYGTAIIVNTKFAADRPEAVKGFLRAYLKGLKETVKSPASAVETVLKRSELTKKDIELERLTMAIRDNILTPEVKAHGYGGIDGERFARAIEQISLTYKFKSEKPQLADIFDDSFMPPAAQRKAN
jgi:NitT/TauT family transport system substrate-binding protein